MPGKIFLSPITRDGSLTLPPAGRWHPTPDFLRQYSADIKLEGQIDDRRLVESVPTVFARPIQFYQALANEDHPAHRSIVGQWRGLLAVFALQRWLELTVEAKEFSLGTALAGRSAEEGARGGADLALLTILHGQLPHPASEWDRWWIIRCDGRLVGATSPWSLVYTAADYECPLSVPWQRDGALADPASCLDPRGTGGRRELALLAAWLDRVMEGERDLWGVADRAYLQEPLSILVRELRLWRNQLRRYDDPSLGPLELVGGAAHVREDPYRHFLTPLDVEGIAAASEFMLDSKSGRQVLVFSRRGAEPGRRVHGSILTEQVDIAGLPGPRSEAGWQTRSGRRVPCPYLIAEEAFFPPKLAQLDLTDDALTFNNKQFALPLTTAFFEHFDADTLVKQRLLVEFSVTEAQVTARLRLPLKGGQELFVARIYDRSTEVVNLEEAAPSLAVWPDFVERDWQHNFGFMSGLVDGTLRVAPVTTSGGRLPASAVDGREKTLRIWNSTEPLLGFVLLETLPSGETTEAGLVLRRSTAGADPRSAPPWMVAVDFGTSSTHLMVREGGAEPRPLELNKRKVVLTEAPSMFAAEQGPRLYPHVAVNPPFPTLLFRNEASLIASLPEAGSGDEVYLARLHARVDDLLFQEELELLVKDLKWARGGERSEIPIREYLSALVRAVACEARVRGVRDLEFEWSYPLALPASTRTSMTDFWHTKASTLAVPGVLSIRAGKGISESEAVCRFFSAAPVAALPVGASALSIAVDLGGGSTDIAFWKEGRLLGQVSLKLAANDVLVPLVGHPKFWKGLVAACAPQVEKLVDPENIMLFPAVPVNVVLTQAIDHRGDVFRGDPRQHPMAVALASKLPSGERPWVVARSAVYLLASGLAFYLGLHARKWLDEVKIREVTLRLGGRGSSLLAWVARGTNLEDLLRDAFVEGASLDRLEQQGPPPRLNVYAPGTWYDPATPLKSEVAAGLLSPPLEGETPERPSTTIVGELGWTEGDGRVLPWDAELGAVEFKRLEPPPNPNSGYYAHFRTKVLPKHVEKLSLDQQGLGNLRLDFATVQNHLRSALGSGYEVLQPVFAVELKTLLESYLSKSGALDA